MSRNARRPSRKNENHSHPSLSLEPLEPRVLLSAGTVDAEQTVAVDLPSAAAVTSPNQMPPAPAGPASSGSAVPGRSRLETPPQYDLQAWMQRGYTLSEHQWVQGQYPVPLLESPDTLVVGLSPDAGSEEALLETWGRQDPLLAGLQVGQSRTGTYGQRLVELLLPVGRLANEASAILDSLQRAAGVSWVARQHVDPVSGRPIVTGDEILVSLPAGVDPGAFFAAEGITQWSRWWDLYYARASSGEDAFRLARAWEAAGKVAAAQPRLLDAVLELPVVYPVSPGSPSPDADANLEGSAPETIAPVLPAAKSTASEAATVAQAADMAILDLRLGAPTPATTAGGSDAEDESVLPEASALPVNRWDGVHGELDDPLAPDADGLEVL